MTNRHPEISISFTCNDKNVIAASLDALVEIVRTRASRDRDQGVVVTQSSYSSYQVALSTTASYGMTVERRQWASPERQADVLSLKG